MVELVDAYDSKSCSSGVPVRLWLGLPLVLSQFILYLLNSFIKFSNSVSISSLVIPFCNAPFFTLFLKILVIFPSSKTLYTKYPFCELLFISKLLEKLPLESFIKLIFEFLNIFSSSPFTAICLISQGVFEIFATRSEERRVGKECRSRW